MPLAEALGGLRGLPSKKLKKKKGREEGTKERRKKEQWFAT
jgi:hypothetical protein